MKYVYVLTSTLNDLYYEQALMSVWSLRHHMKDAQIIILVDNKTKLSFTDELKRTELEKLATEIISIDFEDKVSNVERSRLIKTAIPDYVNGSFLYIDCDTIICDDLSDIENEPFETAGVLDGHCMMDEHIHRKNFLKRDKQLGFSGTKESNCNINGGLILAKDGNTSKELFKQWNECWKYSAYTKHNFHDQPSLNEANYRTGLKMGHLDGKWNCQPSHGGLAFLKDAKIIHYYSTELHGKNYIPYYKLADKNVQNQIKTLGTIPEDIQKMILDPKFQFNSVHLISDKRIVSIMQSPIIFTIADFKAKFPHVFRLIEDFFAFTRSLAKKFSKRK